MPSSNFFHRFVERQITILKFFDKRFEIGKRFLEIDTFLCGHTVLIRRGAYLSNGQRYIGTPGSSMRVRAR